MVQLQASPIFTAYSTALLFRNGKVPGCPNDIALMWWLGSAPKAAESAENALLKVDNCACTSNPTTSYLSLIPFAKLHIFRYISPVKIVIKLKYRQ
jgi:hypothetical protein